MDIHSGYLWVVPSWSVASKIFSSSGGVRCRLLLLACYARPCCDPTLGERQVRLTEPDFATYCSDIMGLLYTGYRRRYGLCRQTPSTRWT